ncbi:hypothetical protein NDU88_000634 [Pleurodeles waltl]|uniref:Receptor ligand binding region domain-containing protein n=1 Tax=Pleurodeles waltl TaxID=8319 RepID=A0AAV7KQF7_PLEWA|nr:hypothetical protein NDU88_000634 [Pleurodeles waltl]
MERACRLPTSEVTGLSRDGDITLGGIFPLHDDVEFQQTSFTVKPSPVTCQSFRTQNYQALQAMIFAVEDINRNPNFLPNVTLGFQIYDSCRMRQRSLEGTLWMLAGKKQPPPNFRCQQNRPLMGIIGDAGSSSSIVMAWVLGLYRCPQLLHYVKNVHFKNDGGHEVSFNQFGEVPAQYDIINFQQNADGTLKHVRVGRYDSSALQGQTLIINTSSILWASGVTQVRITRRQQLLFMNGI